MRIETVSTGDEVLTGFVTDTNASWLSQRLLENGLQASRRHTVGDDLNEIAAVIEERSRHADILLINGGLGPTSDDKTTEAAARVKKVPLVKNEEWVKRLDETAKNRGIEMDPSNYKQAMLPETAVLINNPIGTACGFKLKINNAMCYFTPGVPAEFKHMVDTQILPELKTSVKAPKTVVRVYFTMGLRESSLAGQLDNMNWPESITLGYRANFPLIEVKLIASDPTEEDLENAEEQLLSVISPVLLSKGEFNIAAQISKLSGVIPLQVLEDGTDGRVISILAQEMHGLVGHFVPVPSDSETLIAKVKKERIRTLAISCESNEGFTIIYFNGITGHLQRLKSKATKEKDRKNIITLAALDMLRRLLSGLPPFAPYENLIRTEQIKFKV
jgi:competence/damage-inducible protein CinA-like protein